MKPDNARARYAPDAEFRYVGGDASLDLIDTVNWTERGLERDRISDYGRLLEWARGAEVLTAGDERLLRQIAREHPRRAANALRDALHVREVLHTLFESVARGRVAADELEEYNALLAAAAPNLRIVREPGGRLAQGWIGSGPSLDSISWVVTWAAAKLLSSDELPQVRVCAGSDCGWLYVDRSRNGLRRWCEMEVCGTIAKNRRRARIDGN